MQRIAIIQNDDRFMNMLEKQLWDDYNVSKYWSGDSFLRNLHYNRPDVIFIDEHLPDYKVDVLLQKIAAFGMEIPVILHVSTREIWIKAQVVKDGAIELVSKGQGSLRHARDRVYALMLKQRSRMRKAEPRKKGFRRLLKFF